jgi:hypothetical protein
MVYLPGYETLLGAKHPKTLFHPSGTTRERRLPWGLSRWTTDWP